MVSTPKRGGKSFRRTEEGKINSSRGRREGLMKQVVSGLWQLGRISTGRCQGGKGGQERSNRAKKREYVLRECGWSGEPAHSR